MWHEYLLVHDRPLVPSAERSASQACAQPWKGSAVRLLRLNQTYNRQSKKFSAGLELRKVKESIFPPQAQHLKKLGGDLVTHPESGHCRGAPAAVDPGGHQTCTKQGRSSIPLPACSDWPPLGVVRPKTEPVLPLIGSGAWCLPAGRVHSSPLTCVDHQTPDQFMKHQLAPHISRVSGVTEGNLPTCSVKTEETRRCLLILSHSEATFMPGLCCKNTFTVSTQF